MTRPESFFVLRTPLLPFDDLSAFGADLLAAAASAEALPAALAQDYALTRQRLRAVVERPEVREALFLASPSLTESLPLWQQDPSSERGQKVERTLIRYFARMAGRPTPFGLCAGYSTGRIGAGTSLVLGPRSEHRRHARLDNDYLSLLVESLLRDPAVRHAVTLRPNSSLYHAGDRIHYVEGRLFETNRARSYELVAVEPTDALECVLHHARDGARLATLVQELVAADPSGATTSEDAHAFVEEVVGAQILVADLAPQITGSEPIHDLVRQLETAAPAAARTLDSVREALAALDASPLGVEPKRYHAIAGLLQPLPAPTELARLFQVDLVKPSRIELGREQMAELARVVELLRGVASLSTHRPLRRFRDAFVERYEAQWVPLCEALDEDAGIGFDPSGAVDDGAPLLQGLRFPPRADDTAAPLTPLQRLVMAKLGLAEPEELVLEAAELERLADQDAPPLPGSFSVKGTLAPHGPSGFRWWLQAVGGPSGVNLLGRFCHGDQELTELVRAHLRAEEAQHPDAVFAEIVHLPEGRIGNVLLRPLLRDYEIPYLGRSGAAPDRQLPVDDLLVGVVLGRVVLRSRRLGREVIPRLSTAHAFFRPTNLGVYRFLAALQHQDRASLGFDEGVLANLRYLPRVRLGNVVLALRRWLLLDEDLEPLRQARDAAARFGAVRTLRHRLRWPRFVAVADGDNLLPVDLENVLFIDTVCQLLKERTKAVIVELFGAPGCVAGSDGRYVGELIVPMLSPTAPRPPTLPTSPAPRLPRARGPGSEWLYAKLYSSAGSMDRVIREIVAPLVTDVERRALAADWFFIRYRDPDPHVRLRFTGDPTTLWRELSPLLCRAADSPLVRRLQLDTYVREIERYGGDEGMLLSERIFAADARAVLAIIETLTSPGEADARWRLALRGMDQLLDDLSLTLPQKKLVAETARSRLAREFRADATLEKQLGERFRRERMALESLLDRSHDAGGDLEPGLAALSARSERLRPVVAQLHELDVTRGLTVSLLDLAGRYIHMHANRLLGGEARAQELVLYDFLARLYRGQTVRGQR